MGSNALIHICTPLWTHSHRAVTPGNSHKSNSKGWLCCWGICGVVYTCGATMQNPMAVLRHQWGWAVPQESLASAGCICQIYNFSCVTSMCSQSRSSCLLSYMQRQVYKQPRGCPQHFGNFCAWMVYLHLWEWASLTQKHRKSCIPDAFGMVSLCFLWIFGIYSAVRSPSNHIPAWRPVLSELVAWAGIATFNLKHHFSATTVSYL